MTKKAPTPPSPTAAKAKDFGWLGKYMTSQELVLLRNYFYQDAFHRLMLIFLVLLILIGFLVFFLFYEIRQVPRPIYFATTPDGTIQDLVRLKNANMSPAAVLDWTMEAAANSYSFNFVNYRKALQDSRRYFTYEGYQKFLKAIKDSQNLTAVKDRKLVVTAQVTGNATILKDSDSDPTFRTEGAYSWLIQMPMVLVYQSAAQDRYVQNIILTLTVTRVSMLESPRGLGIDSWIAVSSD